MRSTSLEQQVFISLLCQHVGGLCDGTQRCQAGSDLKLCPFPELLLLLLDLLQPGRGGNVWKRRSEEDKKLIVSICNGERNIGILPVEFLSFSLIQLCDDVGEGAINPGDNH